MTRITTIIAIVTTTGCGVAADPELTERDPTQQQKGDEFGHDDELLDGLQDALATPRENLLLVVADDVGIDAVSTYYFGTDPAPTPTLDSLANSGVTFAHGWANPACSPTRASILTGLGTAGHKISNPISRGEGLDPDLDTVADSLSDDGYATGLAGKWHLGLEIGGVTREDKALEHGFDWFAGGLEGSPESFFSWSKYSVDTGAVQTVTRYATFDTTDDAVDWVDRNSHQPWFASVNYNAAHAVRDANGAWTWEPVSKGCFGGPEAGLELCEGTDMWGNPVQYACSDDVEFRMSVECMDTDIGVLLSELDRLGELQDTTVVFVGDNGTEAPVGYDYGLETDGILGLSTDEKQLRDKQTVYQGGVHVPFIVADGYHLAHGEADDRDDAFTIANVGRVEYSPVQVQDLFATFEDIAGVATPLADPSSSFSFAGLLDGTGSATRTHAWVESGTSLNCQRAVMGQRYKLVDDAGTLHLYDILGQHTHSPVDDDEAEQNDLLVSPTTLHSNIATALQAQLPSTPCNW